MSSISKMISKMLDGYVNVRTLGSTKYKVRSISGNSERVILRIEAVNMKGSFLSIDIRDAILIENKDKELQS